MGTRSGRTALVWIRPLRYCWKPLIWFWMTILIGVGVNVGSSWLFTKHTLWDVSDTPLGWLIDHPQITLPLAGALLLLTSLARLAVVQAATQKDNQATPFFSPSLALAQQNRERMRQHLERWYQEFLDDSLQQAAWLDLDLANKPDALASPLTLLVRNAHLPARSLPPGTSIIQVYEDDAHQELLILGEPGSGKSMQLYKLAQHLLTLTETNQTAPLPIIFSLSSWAVKRAPLETWMAEQLTLIYQVPKKLAPQLVQDQQIIPLLDGLDKMDNAA